MANNYLIYIYKYNKELSLAVKNKNNMSRLQFYFTKV